MVEVGLYQPPEDIWFDSGNDAWKVKLADIEETKRVRRNARDRLAACSCNMCGCEKCQVLTDIIQPWEVGVPGEGFSKEERDIIMECTIDAGGY